MATVPPPPSKRQKLAAETAKAEALEATRIPENLGSVRVQFADSTSGHATGTPISIPIAQASAKNLEHLLNDLMGNSDDNDDDQKHYIPYTFSYTPQNQSTIDIYTDLYNALFKPSHATPESLLTLNYTPQSVFRVRAVTRLTASISGHGQPILCVAFPPHTSSRMVSGSGDGTARIWDAETGTPYKTLKGHGSWVLAVSCSPDASLIATGGMDNTVRIWNAKTGDAKATMKGHGKFITALSWEPMHLQEPGRPRVASSSKDGTVRIWETTGGRCDYLLSAHKGTASCVRWGGLGYIYTCGHDKSVRVWDAKTGACVKTLGAHMHWVNHLALSTDFALRTGWWDPMEGPPGTEEGKREMAKRRFERAARRDGKMEEKIATASDDCTTYLWSSSAIAEGSSKPIARLTGHQKQINHVAFSPDGSLLASCGFDNHIKLWRAVDGKFLKTLRAHVAAVYQCAFSPDSRLLVSCSKDSTVKVWDVRKGELKEDLSGHRDEVYAVDWSPVGGRVGSAGRDKTVRLWGR